MADVRAADLVPAERVAEIRALMRSQRSLLVAYALAFEGRSLADLPAAEDCDDDA